MGLLETLRAYPLEQLAAHGEVEETRGRHALYFLNFVQEGGKHYAGTEVITWVQPQKGLMADRLRPLNVALGISVNSGSDAIQQISKTV